MVSLVFMYAIRTDPFANIVMQRPQVIHVLNSPIGVEIVGRGCPGNIRTRWMYLAHVMRFIFDHHHDAQTALQVVRGLLILKEFAQIHLLLFPLSLFTCTVQEPRRLLADPDKSFCEWKTIHNFVPDSQPMVNCVHLLFQLHCPSLVQFACHHCDSFCIDATETRLDSRSWTWFSEPRAHGKSDSGSNHDFYAQRI
jgi:hypothetical protein